MNLSYLNLVLIILLLVGMWYNETVHQTNRDKLEERNTESLNKFKKDLIYDLKNIRTATIGMSTGNTYILLKNNPGNKKIFDDIQKKSTLDSKEFNKLNNNILKNIDKFLIEKNKY